MSMDHSKQSHDRFDLLQQLSKEMRGEIFHWLAEDIYTIRSLGKIATVCKAWSVYVSDNFLWKQLYQHEWPWEDLTEVEVRRVSCAFNWKKMFLHRRTADLVKPPGQHVKLDAPVTLVELYKGVTKRFAQKDLQSLCTLCGGTGAKKQFQPLTCEVCQGAGVILENKVIGQGMHQQQQHVCGKCAGRGKCVSKQHECSGCESKGFILKKSILKVDIPAGMQWGDQLLVEGRGQQASNKEQPGDVVVTLTEKKLDDLIVSRHGVDHLLLEKEITFSESLFGFSFAYQQIDGRKIIIQSTPGVITTSGMVMAIAGEGMPIYGSVNGDRGDLLIKFKVQDARLTKEQILMLQELRPQLETILGAPSQYEPMDCEEIDARRGTYQKAAEEVNSRPVIKVRPRRRPQKQVPPNPPNPGNNNQGPDLFNQFFGQNGQQNYQNAPQNYQNDDYYDDDVNDGAGAGVNNPQCNQQ